MLQTPIIFLGTSKHDLWVWMAWIISKNVTNIYPVIIWNGWTIVGIFWQYLCGTSRVWARDGPIPHFLPICRYWPLAIHQYSWYCRHLIDQILSFPILLVLQISGNMLILHLLLIFQYRHISNFFKNVNIPISLLVIPILVLANPYVWAITDSDSDKCRSSEMYKDP